MSKKVLSLLLVGLLAVFAFALFGCGDDETTTEETETDVTVETTTDDTVTEDTATEDTEAAGGEAAESDYPSRTVEVINQFGPGGGTDLFIRAIGMPMAKITDQSIVGISVTGGGGVPAATEFFNRPTDGYTMMAIGPEEVINHAMGRIDATQFLPVARVQYDQGLFFVGPDSEYESVEQLIEFARENPGDLSIGVTGAAGFDEVLVGLWNLRSEAELEVVPFESSAEAQAAVLGGHTDLMYEEYGPMRALIESGEVTPLVLFSEERLPVLEDVPTALELDIDVTLGRWRGFAFKEGTDQQYVDTMFDVIEEAVEDPLYTSVEEQNMLQYRSELLGPDEFQEFFNSEMETYSDVMEQLDLAQ